MSVGTIIGWAISGLIIGAIARLLHPGREPMTWVATMFLGILGSLVGGFISYALRLGTGPYHAGNWIMSVIGAMILLVIHNRMTAPAAAAANLPGSTTAGGVASNADYKRAVFDDLSKGSQG